MAQSVPSATLLPCIAALPAGLAYGGSDVASGTLGLLARLGPRRHPRRRGIAHVLVPDRRTRVDVTNSTSEGGVRVYLREFTLHPFSANEYFVFPGGCVTYRFRFGPDAEPTLALEAEEAVTFGLRTVLVHKIEQDFGLTLCGAGAPPCVAGD